jgi:hypothetical protein
MIRSKEGFTIDSALDLNLGYHHINLDADAYNKIYIQMQTLTHQYYLETDMFHNFMSNLVQDMEYIMTYLDDLLKLPNNSFKDHLFKLEMLLA